MTECDKDSVSPSRETHVKKIFTGEFLQMDMDYPYLYVAAFTDGLWRIDISNNEFPLKYLPVPDSANDIYEVDDVAASGDDIIVTTYRRIWHSVDGGETWINSEDGIEEFYHALSVARFPDIPERIITDMGLSTKVYWSNNNGIMWHPFDTGIRTDISWIKCNPYKNGETWIYGSAGEIGFGTPYLYCVEDYGKKLKLEVDMADQFECIEGYQHVTSIDFDQDDSNIVYLSVSSSIKSTYKSIDGGYIWRELTSDTLYVYRFAKDSRYTGRFYVVSSCNNIYLSLDTLHTFQWIAGLPEEEEATMDIEYDIEKENLFIAVENGVYVLALADVKL